MRLGMCFTDPSQHCQEPPPNKAAQQHAHDCVWVITPAVSCRMHNGFPIWIRPGICLPASLPCLQLPVLQGASQTKVMHACPIS